MIILSILYVHGDFMLNVSKAVYLALVTARRLELSQLVQTCLMPSNAK